MKNQNQRQTHITLNYFVVQYHFAPNPPYMLLENQMCLSHMFINNSVLFKVCTYKCLRYYQIIFIRHWVLQGVNSGAEIYGYGYIILVTRKIWLRVFSDKAWIDI